MKLTKKQMLIGASLVGLVGVYLIIKSFNKNKNNPPIPPSPPIPLFPPTPAFPIVKGDRDMGSPILPMGKVVDLQKLINLKGYTPKLVEDGIFGSKTEAAVVSYLTKRSVDTQVDLDKLKV